MECYTFHSKETQYKIARNYLNINDFIDFNSSTIIFFDPTKCMVDIHYDKISYLCNKHGSKYCLDKYVLDCIYQSEAEPHADQGFYSLVQFAGYCLEACIN